MIAAPSLYLIQDFAVILLSAAIAAALCKRVNLSPLVGYLLAGVVVGTPEITFVEVTDPSRVKLLSQLGLIFLMFSIGLGFRLQRFKQLGGGLVIACIVIALIMLTLGRLAAGALGFGEGAALFLAAMVMVSSSAVIGKSLQGQGLNHRRFGQLALGVTLLEDMVAIVMLAFLGSYAAMDTAGTGGLLNMGSKVGVLLAFVVLLLVPGLVVVPRLLRKVSRLRHDSEELQTVIVAALLFSMALLTLVSGYSLALGAFLCGILVAESTRQKQVSEAFSGLRDLFVAVFFVAIGMSVDITRFVDSLDLILLGTALALLLRPLAAFLGLVIACEDPDDAFKAGLCLAPIGEFSFVIANLGVEAGILDQRFQVAAVGIAFSTAIISPWIIQRSDGIGKALGGERMPLFSAGLQSYREMWRLLARRQNGSVLWRLLKPRIPQVAAEFLFVSALLVFSKPIYQSLLPSIEAADPALRETYRVGYWVLVAALVLGPLIALARNINAISMLVGEGMPRGIRSAPAFRRAVIVLLRGLALTSLGIWVLNLVPFAWLSGYALIGVAITVLLSLVFGWRFLVRLHSEVAYSLTTAVTQDDPAEAEARSLRQAKRDWGIKLEEFALGSTANAGRSIGSLQIRKRSGATIIGIERQGRYLPSIGPETHVFPGDRLFVTGSPEQIRSMRGLLVKEENGGEEDGPDYSAAILEAGKVRSGSVCEGRTLRSLQWPRLYGVQVVAFKRGEESPRVLEIDEPLLAGDELLMAGAPRALAAVRAQLAAAAESGNENGQGAFSSDER